MCWRQPGTFRHCFLVLAVLGTISRIGYPSLMLSSSLCSSLLLQEAAQPPQAVASPFHCRARPALRAPYTCHHLPERQGVNGTHPHGGSIYINFSVFARRRVTYCCVWTSRFLDSYSLVLGRVCSSCFSCVLCTYHAQAHAYLCSLWFFFLISLHVDITVALI